MRRSGDDRGDAAGEQTGPQDQGEATHVFSRPGYADSASAPDDRTQAFTRRNGTADSTADTPENGPAGRSDGGPHDGLAEGVQRTRTMRRPAPPDTPSDITDGPEDPGPLPGGDGPPPRPRRRRRVRLRWIIALVLLAALATPPATWAWVWYTARADERPASDAIVVLGASQYNGRPSPIFEARLAHAQELYREGVAPAIVTVGGNQPGDNYTEGGSGRDWLIVQGVPAGDVVAIGEGSDTLQSMEAVSSTYQSNDWSSGVIVTDPWHSLRAREMAEDYGMDAATSPARSGPAVVERETQLWYITRETASLWYYWIFDNSSDIDVNAA